VAVKGFAAPEPKLETIGEYRDYNIGRVPFYLGWGVFSLVGDIAICASSKSVHDPENEARAYEVVTYYLLKIKDSIVHRQKRLVYKLQTLVLGTM
jgi:hypothetical protein